MEPWALAATGGGLFGVVVALSGVLLWRARRRRQQVHAGYEDIIIGLRTSYTSLKSGIDALDGGDYPLAFEIGRQLLARPAISTYPTAAIHSLIGRAALELGLFKTASTHLAAAISSSGKGELVPPRATLLRLLAEADLNRCDHRSAAALALRAMDASKDARAKVDALRIAALANLISGDRIEALALVDEAEAMSQDPVDTASARWLRARISAADSDLDAAAELLVTAQRTFLGAGRTVEAAAIMLDIGDLAERRDEPVRASALFSDAANAGAERPHAHFNRAICTARLAGAMARAGDLEAARLHAKEAEDAFARCETDAGGMFMAWVRARIAGAAGEHAGEAGAYTEAIDRAASLNAWYWRDRIALDLGV